MNEYNEYQNSPIYNIFEYPDGTEFKEVCQISCKYLIRTVAKGILNILKKMNQNYPKYYFGNINSKYL